MQYALAGGPIERDGQRLEPELVLLTRLTERLERQRPGSPAVLRRKQNAGARIAGGPPIAVETSERVIEGASGRLRARHYVSPEPDAPLLVYFHGGGFVFGDVDTHDAPCRLLCLHGGLHVLSVEYRLAPEHVFPAAVDDARAALAWAHQNAVALGAPVGQVAVGGDSAGANLAAVAAQQASRDGGPAPVAQILIYPAVDRRRPWPSLDRFGSGFYLTREAIDWFYAQYATAEHRDGLEPDPRLNPLAARDFGGLPPALVVTAGFDPLRDEGEAYARALDEAGTRVTHRRFDGLIHGFINMVGISPACRDAVVEIAGAARLLARKNA